MAGQKFDQSIHGMIMIRLQTQRFGIIERPENAVLNFPGGIFGFELSRRWLLLSDREHGSLFWLQSTDHPDLSLSVVDPREFISDYALRLTRSQIDHVWTDNELLVVLSVLTQHAERLIVNLRNPIVINPKLGSGRQVVTSDDQPIHYELPAQSIPLKQSA